MDKQTAIAAVVSGIAGVVGSLTMLLNSKFSSTWLDGRIKKTQSELELRFAAFETRATQDREEIVSLKESLSVAVQKIEQLSAKAAAAEAKNELLEARVVHLESENKSLSTELHTVTADNQRLKAELNRRGGV